MKYITAGIILSATLWAPTAWANTLEVYQGNGVSNFYIRSNEALIHIAISAGATSRVTGKVWSGESWTKSENIFEDKEHDFDITERNPFLLGDGTIVMRAGNDLVSYSVTGGFRHTNFELDGSVRDRIVGTHRITDITCLEGDTHQAAAKTWDVRTGATDRIELPNSLCTDDLSYFTGTKNTVIDYYTGNVYDSIDNYSVLDTADFSELGYVDDSDDYDSQGYNPWVAHKKNGDTVFAFENHLYGYAYGDQAWRPIITLNEGLTVGTTDDLDYYLLNTADNKNLFAFARTSDKQQYDIYHWTSIQGWQLEQQYQFDEPAELVLPSETNRSTDLYWAFQLNESSMFYAYRWTKAGGFALLTNRSCTSCSAATVEVSKKGKIFLLWGENLTTYAATWQPDSDTWEDYTLIPKSTDAQIQKTQITSKGQWIIEFHDGVSRQIIQWKPDGGWGKPHSIKADRSFFYDNNYYWLYLPATGDLKLKYWSWSENRGKTLTAVSEVTHLESDTTFIFDDRVFLYYTTASNGGPFLYDVALE